MKRKWFLLAVLFISIACSQPRFVSEPSRVETALAEINATAAANAQPEPAQTGGPLIEPTALIIHAPTADATIPLSVESTEPGSAPTEAPAELANGECITNPQAEIAVVTRIIDGDTIEVVMNDQAYRVRYIGIDTPEVDMPFSPEATQKNRELVEGKPVTMYKDVSETDQFDRLLRFVFVEDQFVNYELVRQGYARATTYAPDVSCANTFTQAGAEAQAASLGLWAAEFAEPTPSFSGSACPNGCEQEQPGCVIKGNINSEGEKIYHVPGGGSYNDTIISPDAGERWFCTGGEAEANGWRRARN